MRHVPTISKKCLISSMRSSSKNDGAIHRTVQWKDRNNQHLLFTTEKAHQFLESLSSTFKRMDFLLHNYRLSFIVTGYSAEGTSSCRRLTTSMQTGDLKALSAVSVKNSMPTRPTHINLMLIVSEGWRQCCLVLIALLHVTMKQ